VAQNGMKIIPGKGKAIRFVRARVKIPSGYLVKKNAEACGCKYLGLIIRSDLNWVDQVN